MRDSLLLQSVAAQESDTSQTTFSDAKISFIEEKMEEFVSRFEEAGGASDPTGREFILGIREGTRQGLEEYYNKFGTVGMFTDPITEKLETLFNGSTINDLDERVGEVADAVDEGNEDNEDRKKKSAAILMLVKGVIFKIVATIAAIIALAKLFSPVVDLLKNIWEKLPGKEFFMELKDGVVNGIRDFKDGILDRMSNATEAADNAMQNMHEKVFGEGGPLSFMVPEHLKGKQIGRGADEATAAATIKEQQKREQAFIDSENAVASKKKEIEWAESAGLDTTQLQAQLAEAEERHQTQVGLKQARDDRAKGIEPSPFEKQTEEQNITQYQSMVRTLGIMKEQGTGPEAMQPLENARANLAQHLGPDALARAYGIESAAVEPATGTPLNMPTTSVQGEAGVAGDVSSVATSDPVAEKLENRLTSAPPNVNIKPTNITVPTTTNVVTNNNTHVIGPTPTPYDPFFSTYKQDQLSPHW